MDDAPPRASDAVNTRPDGARQTEDPGRSCGGFTLVEILVAVALMSLTLLAAAPLFAYALRETATGADLGSIGAVAVDRMELLRGNDFFGLAAGGSLSTNDTGFSDVSSPAYTVRWQIVNNATPTTMKTINVRVIATRRSTGLQKEVTVTCLRAR